MKKTLSVLLASTTLACGGGDPSTVTSKTDAAKATSAASEQTSKALAGITAGATSGSVECSGGGKSAVSVTGSAGTSSASATTQTDFTACNTGTVTIDGTLKQTSTITVTESSSVTDTHMEGTLTYSGSPDGICKFDLTAHISISNTATGSLNTSYTGTVCGFEADEVFSTTSI